MKRVLIFVFFFFYLTNFTFTFAQLTKINKVDYIVWRHFFYVNGSYYWVKKYDYTFATPETIRYYGYVPNNILFINNGLLFITTSWYIRKLKFNVNHLPEVVLKDKSYFLDESDFVYTKELENKLIGAIIKKPINYSQYSPQTSKDGVEYFYIIFRWKYKIYDMTEYRKLYLELLNALDQNLDPPLIVKRKGKYYVYYNVRKFLLWNNLEDLYNIQKLWKILFTSFWIKTTYNLPYSYEDFKLIEDTAKKFKWKWLINLYKYMQKNFKYNYKVLKKISQKHNNKNKKNNENNENNENDIVNWDLFFVFKSKIWVCKWLSDLFSLMALMNWYDADIVLGVLKRKNNMVNLYHQVSKINGKYFDISSDLKNPSKQDYFGMTKERLSQYFLIIAE